MDRKSIIPTGTVVDVSINTYIPAHVVRAYYSVPVSRGEPLLCYWIVVAL